ncbi:hypothetical protein [Kineococcus esterisolvens]|uniref:hypothetical protein n=1 Tax=unclassified Kineococcus TaxID=2621656 RepID=UPI003D7D0876
MTTLERVMAAMRSAEAVETDGASGYYVALRHASYRVAFHLSREGASGEWLAQTFTVQPEGVESLTGSSIRALPIGQLLARARSLASAAARGGVSKRRTGKSPRLARPSEVQLSTFLRDGRGGPARSDLDYARLALEYVLRVEDGDRAPAVSLANQYGSTPGTWTNRITEARRRGLLTPVKRGESGGRLTEQAEQLLFGNDPTDDETEDV